MSKVLAQVSLFLISKKRIPRADCIFKKSRGKSTSTNFFCMCLPLFECPGKVWAGQIDLMQQGVISNYEKNEFLLLNMLKKC